MGATQTSTRNKKGVAYSKETNEIIDCLFCRIARGELSENPLWYRDEHCAIFVPREPAARLHFLIVPLEHIQNISKLSEKHRPLLEHMRKVAIEQLRIHSQHLGIDEAPLTSRAPPPSNYGFNRGQLPVLVPLSDTYRDEITSNDDSFVLCFHRPPYNSIDHLHLHALQKPYRTLWNKFTFGEKFPWHGPLDDVLHNLSSEKAKL